jgi:Fic family protein
MKPLPLKDRKGKPFVYSLPDPVLEYIQFIDQNAGGLLGTAGPDGFERQTQEKYLIHSLMEEAINSSQLEGATTTRQVAKEMIKTDRPPRDTSEQMILNNYHTMWLIRDRLKQEMSKQLAFDLHVYLTEKTLKNEAAAGRFRKSDEPVAVYAEDTDNLLLHNPPIASELETRMETLCAFANGENPGYFIPKVVRAILLHFWMAYDHPFVDGNGRTARALFYWAMLRQGFWLCEYLSISQIIKEAPVKYGMAFLYSETDDNDLTYFILYHLGILKRAIEQLHSYIRNRQDELKKTEALLRSMSMDLNHRQIDLLCHALRHAYSEYTIRGYEKTNSVVYQTARTDLFDLVKKGMLVQKKKGSHFVFRPVEGFEDLLKGGKRR